MLDIDLFKKFLRDKGYEGAFDINTIIGDNYEIVCYPQLDQRLTNKLLIVIVV